MRGIKAKRLRKAGLKSGPAERPEPTEQQLKKIDRKIMEAKAPYSETKHLPYRSGFSSKVRENIIKRRQEKLDNDSI